LRTIGHRAYVAALTGVAAGVRARGKEREAVSLRGLKDGVVIDGGETA
jgi:hypothetical protein